MELPNEEMPGLDSGSRSPQWLRRNRLVEAELTLFCVFAETLDAIEDHLNVAEAA